MANYKQLGYGSEGTDVIDLQKRLNATGKYNLDPDGIYGSETQAAVTDYQKQNGLQVDGIAGKETLGHIYGGGGSSSSSSSGSSSATGVPETTDTTSETVRRAEEMLQQHLSNKPGAYQSTWQEQLDDTIDKLLNREEFTYDVNKDALYQIYADLYVNQGKQAMMDAMGQAQAMTGGYGNSYAQQVGQQTYQEYLQGLNDKVPELYQLALNQYLAEGDKLSERAALLAQMENQDYSRYRDGMSDYMIMLDHLYGRYDTERGFDYQLKRDEIEDQRYEEQFALQKKSSGVIGNTGGNDTDSNNTGGYTPKPDGWDEQKIRDFQGAYGLTVDGIWGPETADMYDKKITNKGGYKNSVSTEPSYSTIYKEVENLISVCESKGEINSLIRGAVKDGIITQNEAQKLLSHIHREDTPTKTKEG